MKKTIILVIICSIILLFFIEQGAFTLKTDIECLSNANAELLNQIRSEKYIKCFKLVSVKDSDKKTKQYRWIRTWENKSDTLEVVAVIGRQYWTERYSYILGNPDIWYKLNLVDLRETKLDSTLLDERAFKVMEKYKDYKICN